MNAQVDNTQPLWIKIIRWTFRGLGILLLTVLVVIVIAYFFVFRPSFVEGLIENNFNKMSNGRLELTVKKASLLRGFEFHNITVYSGPDFAGKPLAKLEKLKLAWNIPGFWAGDFGIHEIGIYKPEIFLIQRGTVWNTDTLMKPGKPKEKEEKEEKVKKKGKAPKELTLPFSYRIFVKLVLEDFRLVVDGSEGKAPMEAGVKDFTFRTHLLTKKTNRVPLTLPQLADNLHTFLIQLNPQETIDVYFRSPAAATATPFDLHLLVGVDGEQEKPAFVSRLKVGNSNIPVSLKGQQKLPLGFDIGYNLNYNPHTDFFTIEKFKVGVLGQTWLRIVGNAEKATDPKKMKARIEIAESDINLTALYPYFVSFTGNKTLRFAGNISLAPLLITGEGTHYVVDGAVSLRNVIVRTPSAPISIPAFRLYYFADADTKNEQPLDIAKAGFKGSLNGASLVSDIVFRPGREVDVQLKVHNFNPAPFSKGQTNGNFNVDLSVTGPAENHLKTNLHVFAPWFTYTVGRGKSPVNKMDMVLSADIDSPNLSFKTVSVALKQLSLKLKNSENRDSVIFRSDAKVTQAPGSTDVGFFIREFSLHPRNLVTSVPESLAGSLAPLSENVRTKILISGESFVQIRGKSQDIKHETRVHLPDFRVDDIILKAGIGIQPGDIRIRQVLLTGLKDSLRMEITGRLHEGMIKTLGPEGDTIVRQKGMHRDISFKFALAKKEAIEIGLGNFIQGAIGLNAKVSDHIIAGNMKIDNFSLKSPKASISRVNFDFPFEHDMLKIESVNLTAASREKIVQNYNYSEPYNFTIESVDIAHPFVENENFRLLYSQNEGKNPAFGAVMRYRENVFEIPVMQMNMLNGNISGRDIFFNLGPLKPEKMQFNAFLQIKDIDLKQLMDPEKAKAIKDGTVRGDIRITVNNLKQPIENLTGYVKIYKIGQEFGKQALKVVKPDSNALIDGLIDNTITVQSIDLSIREGLVYAKILYKKGLLANMTIAPSGEKIEQNRIPIPEFMQRASREAAAYSVEGEEEEENP